MKNLFILILLSFNFTAVQAEVKTELTGALAGVDITYTFSGGNTYNIKFADKHLSYRFASGGKSDKWWGPYPYKAMKTEKGEYFVAWFEEDYYATIAFDPKSKSLYGSSISGKDTFFEKAEISKYKR